MNQLFSNLHTWLISLGSSGYVLCAAVPVAAYLIYRQFKATPPPAIPTPPSSATPVPLAGSQQLLNVLATAMGWVPSGAVATTAHIPTGMLAKLTQEVTATTQAQVAGHVAALADLGAPVVKA